MVAFAFLISILLSGSSCTADYPFRNVTLSWNERVDDLVSRLTLEEIMYQMARGGGGPDGGPAPAIPRLGIGPYQWTTECLSGDVFKNTTSFPMPIGMGASFSPDLMFRVAEAIGIEVRAMYNDYRKQGDYHMHTSISCLSPVINIMRHPFWGRNQEVYGEDPFLSGVLATNYVKGLQGNHSRYVRANAGCKHFDAYAGPDNVPSSRFTFNAIVSERDLRLTFLPAFRKCVEAGTYNLMCSYNSINGIPACSNYKLLTTILRDEWNFTGYVIADFDAIQYTMTQHKLYYNSLEAVTGSVNAGCNLEFPGDGAVPVYYSMLDAINKTMLLESTVREKVKPLFYIRMRLGEFDPPSMNPYTQLNLSVIESNTHRQLAVEAAVKSFVLLKKEANFIPLKKTLSKIAIIGPMANNSKELFGDYSPFTDPKFTSVPLDGLRKLSKNVAYTPGCNDGNKCIKYSTQEIQIAVQGADVVFVCLGTGIIYGHVCNISELYKRKGFALDGYFDWDYNVHVTKLRTRLSHKKKLYK